MNSNHFLLIHPVKHIGYNLLFVGLLLIISIITRSNIVFLYSNLKFAKNLDDRSIISRLLLINSSNNQIEKDLIEMMKNDPNSKLKQIDRSTLNKFNQLIQLMDRFLILFYCLIILIYDYLYIVLIALYRF